MPLLDRALLQSEPPSDLISSLDTDRFDVRARTVDPDPFDSLLHACGPLLQDELLMLVSQGSVSAHHVLAYVVDQIGPCHLKFTSWAISTKPIQTMINYLESKVVLSLECILSDRVTTECPAAIQLLRANCDDVHLAKIHAKGFIAWNDRWRISVNMTANFTQNPRIETYQVNSNPAVFEFHKRWINEVIERR